MIEIDLESEWERQVLGARFDRRLQEALFKAQLERIRGARLRKSLKDFSVVMCIDKEDGVLKSAGFSEPSDMFLNNFLNIFAAWFKAVGQTKGTALSLVDHNGNTNTSFYNYSISSNDIFLTFWNNPPYGGTSCRIGKDDTAASRTDYNVKDPFTTAPESGYVGTTPGSWASGQGLISFSAIISAGGSGTIKENAIFYNRYDNGTSSQYYFAIFRNILSPGVSFSAGDTILVSYGISC